MHIILAITSYEPFQNKARLYFIFTHYMFVKFTRVSSFTPLSLARKPLLDIASVCPFVAFFLILFFFLLSRPVVWRDANNCPPSAVFMVLKQERGRKNIWICHCKLRGAVAFRSTFTCPRQQRLHTHSISCRLNGPARKNKLNGDI